MLPARKGALVHEGAAVDLTQLPIQTCWPGDVAPLITWPLVITRGPHKERQNLGIYRMQLLGPNKLIMRWLSHRGGAPGFSRVASRPIRGRNFLFRWPWVPTLPPF